MRAKLRILWKCSKCFSSKQIDAEDENLALNNLVRSCYLNHLHKVLLGNYRSCPLGQLADCDFSEADVRHCAASMELQAIQKCVVVVLYQRAMLNMISDIKKDTRRHKMHRKLKDLVLLRRDKETQTDGVASTRCAAVQTSGSSRDVRSRPEPRAVPHHREGTVKKEHSSPSSLQQHTPPPSPPVLEVPLPGPGQQEAGATSPAQPARQHNLGGQLQPLSALGGHSQVQNKIQQSTSALGGQSQVQNTSHQSLSALGGQSQVQDTSQQPLSALGGQSRVQDTSQQPMSALGGQSQVQNTSQQPLSALGGQSLVQNTSQQSMSALGSQSRVQDTSQQSLSASSGQSQVQDTIQQPLSVLGGLSQVHNTSQQSLSALGGQSRVQDTSQQPMSALGGQSQVQNTSQEPLSALGGQSQIHITSTSQQPMSALGGQSKVQNTSQQSLSALGGQSQVQNVSQQLLSALGGQSQVQNTCQQPVSTLDGQLMLQNASQEPISVLGGQSKVQNTSQPSLSALGGKSQVQNTSQQPLSAVGGQSQVQNTSNQPMSALYGQSQVQNTSLQLMSTLGDQSQVQNTSQQPMSELGGQSQIQNTSQEHMSVLDGQSQVQNTWQQPVLTLDGHMQLNTTKQQHMSTVSDQSYLHSTSQQSMPLLGGQLQLQNKSQQHMSALGDQSQSQNTSQQHVSAPGGQPQFQNTRQQHLPLMQHRHQCFSSFGNESEFKNASWQHVSQLQNTSKPQMSALVGQSQVQDTSKPQVSALGGQSQVQDTSKPQVSALGGQSQVQDTSKPQVSALVGQSQVQDTSKLQMSALGGQSQVQDTSKPQVSALGGQPQVQDISKPQVSALVGQSQVQDTRKLQMSALGGQSQVQDTSKPQVSALGGQPQVQLAAEVTVCREPGESCGQHVKQTGGAASEEQLQLLALQHLQSAYEQWLQTASELQRLIITRQQTQSRGQLLQSVGQQSMQAACLQRLRKAYQAWSRECRPDNLRKLQAAYVQWLNAATSCRPDEPPPPDGTPGRGRPLVSPARQRRPSRSVPSCPGKCIGAGGDAAPRGPFGQADVVKASPIPVVLMRTNVVVNKVHFQQHPRNPNNIEIIPVSEETLIKLEKKEQEAAGSGGECVVAASSGDGVVSRLPTLQRDGDHVGEAGQPGMHTSVSEPHESQRGSEEVLRSEPSPAFSSADDESTRSDECSKTSVDGEETLGTVGCGETRPEAGTSSTSVEEDLQTKLLLRELLSGSNTPTDEIIEGTEIPYDAIVSGLQKVARQSDEKQRCCTDEDEEARAGVDGPGRDFWRRELLVREEELARKWHALDSDVFKKARRKQHCVRLFGSDQDLFLTERELNICKGRIIPWIVRELKPYYRQGRVISRPVFKSVARHMANRLVARDCYPGVADVRKAVTEFFDHHEVVSSVDSVF